VPSVLVVDDSPSDRLLAGRLLQREPNLAVAFAGDGLEALDYIRRETPDAVVTDLQMPESDGLELVEAVKRDFPRLPVILMTARGSEEIAAEALKKGAASYVPKSGLATHLRDTVMRVLSAAAADKSHSRLMHSLAECRCRFVLQADPELIESLTAHVQEMLRCLPLGDESERLRVGIAVKHALLNALYHGNLELPLDAETVAGSPLILERIASACGDRLVTFEAVVSPEQAQFTIQHQGPGFPVADCDPSFDESTKHFPRGILLMRSIMDEVCFDAGGRSVTLVKRACDPSGDLMVEE
jgi:CheY-like chemotaxis protein